MSRDCVKHAIAENEPQMVILLEGQGGNQFQFQGNGTRVFLFQNFGGKGLEFRCPLSLWRANKNQLAREMFDQQTGNTLTLIPTVE